MVNQNDYDSNHNEIYLIIWTFVGLESLKGVCKYVKGKYWYLHVYVKGKQTNNSPFFAKLPVHISHQTSEHWKITLILQIFAHPVFCLLFKLPWTEKTINGWKASMFVIEITIPLSRLDSRRGYFEDKVRAVSLIERSGQNLAEEGPVA